MSAQIDDSLMTWEEVEEDILSVDRQARSLLLGNGASRSVWDDFGYPSLFNIARDTNLPVHLTGQDRELFETLETKNFEAVLAAITITRKVNEVVGLSTRQLKPIYDRVRDSLFHAINKVHIPYDLLTPFVKSELVECLSQYRNVFTTNYDLLPYWSYMSLGGRFKDYFWGYDNSFDENKCDIWGDSRAYAS